MRLILAALLLALSILAQDKPAEPKAEGKADQKKGAARVLPNPTNLKILKATTGPEVGQIMRTFTAGLGVQCAYCHAETNFASEDNPKKATARHMIEMTQKINANFPDGKMHVTCFTCHRGEADPKTAPEPKGPGL